MVRKHTHLTATATTATNADKKFYRVSCVWKGEKRGEKNLDISRTGVETFLWHTVFAFCGNLRPCGCDKPWYLKGRCFRTIERRYLHGSLPLLKWIQIMGVEKDNNLEGDTHIIRVFIVDLSLGSVP